MNYEDFELFLDSKKVHIERKNGFHYSGQILKLNYSSLVFLDKFNRHHIIDFDDIKILSEIGGESQ